MCRCRHPCTEAHCDCGPTCDACRCEQPETD